MFIALQSTEKYLHDVPTLYPHNVLIALWIKFKCRKWSNQHC